MAIDETVANGSRNSGRLTFPPHPALRTFAAITPNPIPTEDPMRTRTPAALAVVAALTLAACGNDDDTADEATPVTTEAMADDEMTDDEMADDEMADDKMTDDEMTDDETADDEMADDMSDEEMAAAEGDLVVVASARDDLTTLVAAIEAAGLATTLAEDGPFTIFAPNDAAEEYLGEMGMTAEDALADTTFLSTLLQGHVVEAADDSSMVAGMVDNPFVSLAGTELPVTVDGDTITIGGAEVIEADVFATNGVIHVIDTVLAPA
jgi:uncharacterized surface protein with fasciclin (FAS1) repeats